MKKILTLVLSLLMFTTAGASLIACGGGGDAHEHTFSEEWSTDATYHWRNATCEHTDEVGEKGEHAYGEIVVDEPATPIKKGKGHKTCTVCGRTIYNLEVDYTYDPNSYATLVFDVRGGEPIEPVKVKAGTTINLADYTVQRDGAEDFEFEGWIVGGKKVDSIVLTGNMVAHASYSIDDYVGKQSIQLGRYPQTVVTDQNVINALDAMEFSDRNANGYYEYQGNEYAKEVCTFESNAFNFERFKSYYFKVEPITWVRSNGRWTTLQVLDFVDEYKLLEYLNGDFYNTFNDLEKSIIGDTKLNEEDPYKLFLWNVDEFASSHPTATDKKQSLTDYALFKDDTKYYKEDRFTTDYWLLNPINYSGIDTVSHYTFTGNNWQTDAAYLDKAGLIICLNLDFDGITSMTGDELVTLTYNTNGGDALDADVIIADEKYQLPTPTKEGFEFLGWYKDAELKQFVSAYNFETDKDLILYAKWKELPPVPDTFTITYELNGGAFASLTNVKNEFTEESVVTFLNPTKASSISYTYKFEGWYLEENFVTKVTSTAGLTDNVTVYAKWKEEGIYFFINYEIEYWHSLIDGTNPTKILRAEGSFNLPSVMGDSNQMFIGWKEKGHSEIITSISTNRTSNVTLTPVFIRAYDITWNLSGGTLENEEDLPTVIYADAPAIDFTQLVPTKEGYKFLYWNVSWKGRYGVGYETILSFPDGYNLPTTSSTPTITAVFSQVYSLKVDYMGGNVDGDTDIEVIDFGATEGAITFKNPVKEGATLLGWSDHSACYSEATYSDLYGNHVYFKVNTDGTTTFESSKMFSYNSSTGVNDIYRFDTIYAIWDKVTVSFVTNMDGVTKDPITVTYNQSFDVTGEEFILANTNDKKFGGWYKDEALTNKCSSSALFYTNGVLYAKWLPKLTITIVFEDGSTDVQYVFEGDTLSTITYQLGTGQYFGGAYLDEGLTNKISSLSKYKPKGDMTIYIVRKNL